MVDVNQELWIETRLGSKSGRAPYYYNANTLQVRHTAPSPKRATVISQDDLIFSFVYFLCFLFLSKSKFAAKFRTILQLIKI